MLCAEFRDDARANSCAHSRSTRGVWAGQLAQGTGEAETKRGVLVRDSEKPIPLA